MPFRTRGHWTVRVFFFLVIGVALLYGALHVAARWWLRGHLEQALAAIGARLDRPHEPAFELELLSGSLRMTGLRMLPLANDTGMVSTQGEVDTLMVTGFSYWAYLRDRIQVRSVQLRSNGLRIRLAKDTVDTPHPTELGSIACDRLDVQLRTMAFGYSGTDHFRIALRALRYAGGGFRLAKRDLAGWSVELPDERDITIDSLAADLHDEQCITVGSFTFRQSSGDCEIIGSHFGPYEDLERFARTRRLESDVADCDIPLVRLRDIHVPVVVDSGDFSARSVLVANADVHIYRDKMLPDGRSHFVPLLARLIRDLPEGCGADSIVLRDCDITYNERGAPDRGFGRVPFLRMSALVTGGRHVRTDSAHCAILANCMAFGGAPVAFRFDTPIHDTTDRFDMEAHIGRMPSRLLNPALGPLLNVQAITGTIDTVVIHMRADDRAARGRVRLAYRDLRMVQGTVAAKKARTRPLSVLLNAIVKNDQRLGDVSATDADLAIPRLREHSMFNYLWRGLREGSKKVLLPGVLEP